MPSPIDDMEPEEAPEWFWTLIERSEGDRERLRELATALSQEQLQQAFEYYRMLASWVAYDDIEEGPSGDRANWIVAQGKDEYFDIYKQRKQPPAPKRGRAGFGG